MDIIEQKKYILASDLDKKDRLKILKMLVDENAQIYENGDGCRINLDYLKDDVINRLYIRVKSLSITPQVDLID